jgi:hypothetical protein
MQRARAIANTNDQCFQLSFVKLQNLIGVFFLQTNEINAQAFWKKKFSKLDSLQDKTSSLSPSL